MKIFYLTWPYVHYIFTSIDTFCNKLVLFIQPNLIGTYLYC